MSVLKSDSVYTNPDALRLLYLNPKNPLGGLEETKPDVAVPAGQTVPEIHPPPTGSGSCPALGQFILIRLDAAKGGITYKKVEEVNAGIDFAWHPVRRTFHQIIAAEIMPEQPLAKVVTFDGAQSICSLTHPVIQDFEDTGGQQVFDLINEPDKAHKAVSIIDFEVFQTEIALISAAGTGKCVRISLEDGFIYASGTDPLKTIAAHNKPPVNPNVPVE